MVGLSRRWMPVLVAVLAVAAVVAVTSPTPACPFCTLQGQTLTGEVNQASLVLFGTLSNANPEKETTDLTIESVIKDHSVLAKRKVVTLKKYVPPSLDGAKYKYLVFCDIFKGEIDAYRGVAVKPDSKMPAYLAGALQVKDKPVGERLRFFFDYLDNSDVEISNDAYKEFGNSDYKDFQAMAKDLPAERVIKWLKDANTPAFRFGLYASMLGHCGKPADAKVLRALLEDPERRAASGVDGIMAGYVMLDSKEGWQFVLDTLKNPKNEFMFRYAALKAIRFLYEYRPDVIAKKDLIEGACILLAQEDMADLTIEDLRKWQIWDKADRVLAVRSTPAYKQSIVRRSVLRYCLQCQGNKAAEAYVAERRKEDAEGVKEAEELLKLEQEAATPTKTDPKAAK